MENNSVHEYTEEKKKQKLLEQRLKKIEAVLEENTRKLNIIERSLRGKRQ